MNNKAEIVITAKNQTKGAFKSVKAGLSSVSNSAGGTAVKIAALAGVAGFGLLIKKSLQANDELAKFADRVGISTEKLAGLQLAAEINGTSAETLNKGLQLLNKNLGDVGALGKGEAKSALEAIGLEAKNLIALPVDEKFKIIADEIKGLSTQAEKGAVAQALFGRAGSQMLNMMQEGSEGLAKYEQEAVKLGLALSRVDAAKLEAANDSMLRVSKALDGIGNKAAIVVAPLIEEVSMQFVEMATSGTNMEDTIKTVFTNVTGVVGVFADGLHGIEIIVKLLETGFRGLGMVLTDVFITAYEGFLGLENTLRDFTESALMPVVEGMNAIGIVSDETFNNIKGLMSERIETPQWIEDIKTSTSDAFGVAQDELNALLMEKLPSEVFATKIEQILANAEVRAEAAVAKIKAGAGLDQGGDVDATFGGDEDSAAEERELAELASKLERLQSYWMTEKELLTSQYVEESQLLIDARDKDLLTESQYRDNKAKLDKEHKKAEEKLDRVAWVGKARMMTGALGALASIGSKNSKKAFKIQKAAALAEAAVSLPAAVIDSFENGGGYPWGIAPAAAMLATGIRQIQTIKSQSFGGGGSVSSSVGGGGGGGASPTAQPLQSLGGVLGTSEENATESPGKVVNIQIHGDLNSNDANRLLTDLRVLINENDEVLIEQDSRNGQEIATAGGLI